MLLLVLVAAATSEFVRPPSHQQPFNLSLKLADQLGLSYQGIAHNSSSAQA
jgi:hypothetical protein